MVTALVAATVVLFNFRFCLLVPVVLCAIDLLNDIRGGRTWRMGIYALATLLV